MGEFVLGGEGPQTPGASEGRVSGASLPTSLLLHGLCLIRALGSTQSMGSRTGTSLGTSVECPSLPIHFSGFLSFPLSPWMTVCWSFLSERGERPEQVKCLYVLEPAVLSVNPRALSCVNLHTCWNLSSLGLTATLHSQAHLKADP